MNKKIVALIAVLILVFAGLMIFYSSKLVRPSSETATRPQKHESNQVFAERILTKPDATAKELRRALQYLARKQDPRAFDRAKEVYASKDSMMRSVACAAFGLFKDLKAKTEILTCLDDSADRVRQKTLESIARVKEPGREELINDYIGRDSISARDKAVAYGLIARISADPKLKKASVDKLYLMAKTGDDIDTYFAAMKLAAVARKQERVQKYFSKKAKESKNPKLLSLSIRNLAANKDSWYKANLQKFLNSDDSVVRETAIMSIHQLCPRNHWEILENIKSSETNSRVLTKAATSAYILGGPSAGSYIDSILKSGKLSVRHQEKVQKYLKRVASRKQDRCNLSKSGQ